MSEEIDLKQNFDDDDDIGLNDGGTILEEDEVMTCHGWLHPGGRSGR